MPNTGPPFFATDAAEATRAHDHQVSARRRVAFQASLQAKLNAPSARFYQLITNWTPLIRKDGEGQ